MLDHRKQQIRQELCYSSLNIILLDMNIVLQFNVIVWVRCKVSVCMYVSVFTSWMDCVHVLSVNRQTWRLAARPSWPVLMSAVQRDWQALYVSTHISHLWFILTLFGFWWELQAATHRSSPRHSPNSLSSILSSLFFSLFFFFFPFFFEAIFYFRDELDFL